MRQFPKKLNSDKFRYVKQLLVGLSCLGAFLLVGCDSVTECDCEDEIDDLLEERGTPSSFDIEESADYNRHEYTYDNADGSQDIYVFEWGDEDPDGNTIDVCCLRTVTRSDGTSTDGTGSDDTSGNDAPNANSFSVSTTENTAITFDVESHASDPDGDTLTVSVESQPSNGSATLESDQDVTYTPDSGFTGTDTFTYEVCDPGDLCDSATVTVTVS